MMHTRNQCAHLGSSFSCVEILTVLFFSILRWPTVETKYRPRDRFVLSKGHGASALYAVLARRGAIPREWLDTFQQDGGFLAGHPDRKRVPCVGASTGSLGHGLSLAVGQAWALRSSRVRVFVLLSDGEMQEGSVWESAASAVRWRLSALTAIVDNNGWQGFSRTSRILDIQRVKKAFEALGWGTTELDGHDITALLRRLRKLPLRPGRPSLIIANTIKGKGLRDYEDRLEGHYHPPAPQKLEQYLTELRQRK